MKRRHNGEEDEGDLSRDFSIYNKGGSTGIRGTTLDEDELSPFEEAFRNRRHKSGNAGKQASNLIR